MISVNNNLVSQPNYNPVVKKSPNFKGNPSDTVTVSTNETKKNKNIGAYIIGGLIAVGGAILLAVNLKKGKKIKTEVLSEEEILKRVAGINEDYHKNIQMIEDIRKTIKTKYASDLEKYLSEDGAKLDDKIKAALKEAEKLTVKV